MVNAAGDCCGEKPEKSWGWPGRPSSLPALVKGSKTPEIFLSTPTYAPGISEKNYFEQSAPQPVPRITATWLSHPSCLSPDLGPGKEIPFPVEGSGWGDRSTPSSINRPPGTPPFQR